MSFLPVIEYLAGFGVFAFLYGLLDGVIDRLVETGVSQTGSTFDLLYILWAACLIIYLVFGGIWVVRKYNESQYQGGRPL